MQKLKYFSVFLISSTIVISFTNYGLWTYLPLVFAFVFIPILELLFRPNPKNSSPEKKERLRKDPFFSLILYSIVPIQFGLVIFFLEKFEVTYF